MEARNTILSFIGNPAISQVQHDAFYLIGGQSNAAEPGTTTPPAPNYLLGTFPTIQKWNGSSFASKVLLNTTGWGPGDEMLYREQVRKNKTIYYYRNATAGCSLANTGAQCDLSGILSNGLTAYNNWIANANPINPVCVFIWIQGNQDAAVLADSQNYQSNLITWYANVRSNFSQSAMYILFDRLSINCTKPFITNVRNGQMAVGEMIVGGKSCNIILDSDDCPLQDGDHYNATGATTLGQRFSTKIGQLLN